MTHLTELAIGAIGPNPDQPRKSFEREPLEELADSIRAVGILEPIVVQAWPPSDEGRIGTDPDWRIIAGERRWRAAQMAGLETVPAIIRNDLTDAEAFELSMIENVLRRDMNPMEEARGYERLLGMGLSVDDIATRTGRKARAIQHSLTLTKLEPGIADLVAKRHLTGWEGARLATLTWNGQARALDVITRNGLSGADRDRVIGQVWNEEHQVEMWNGLAAVPASERRAAADLRVAVERAARALGAADELLGACEVDDMTIALAEAVAETAARLVRTARRARTARMLEDAG